MANKQGYTIDNVKELVKNFLFVDDILSDKVIIKCKGNDEKAKKIFGENGLKLIKKLNVYMTNMKAIQLSGQISIRDAIIKEFSKFSAKEKNEMSKNDMLKDPRIDWQNIIKAYSDHYASYADAKAVGVDSLVLAFGDAFKENGGFVGANARQLVLTGENGQLRRQKKAYQISTIATGVVAALLAATSIFFGVRANNSLKDANSYKKLNDDKTREIEELNAFQQLVLDLGRDGSYSKEDMDDIEKLAELYAGTDKAGEYSSTKSIELIRQYAELKRDSENMVDGATVKEYEEFIEKSINVIRAFNLQMADKSLSEVEKQTLRAQIENIVKGSTKALKNSSISFGNEMGRAIESVAVLSADVDDLTGEVDRLNQNIALLKSGYSGTVDDLKNDIARLEANIVTLNDQIDSLKAVIADQASDQALLDKLTEAQNKLLVAEGNLAQAVSQNQKLVDENAILTTEKANLESTVSTLQSEKANLETLKATLEDKCNQLEAEINALKNDTTNAQKISQLEAMVTDLKSDITDLKNAISDKDAQLAALEAIKADDEAFIKDLYNRLHSGYSGESVDQMKNWLLNYLDIEAVPGNNKAKDNEGSGMIR